MTTAMVVPVGDRNISTIRACLEFRLPSSFRSLSDVVFVDCDGRAATGLAAMVLEARLLAVFGIGILHSSPGGIAPPPPKPHLGHQAGGAGSRNALVARNGHSTALFAVECQSFLVMLLLVWGNPAHQMIWCPHLE
jgi:hypothetical protein